MDVLRVTAVAGQGKRRELQGNALRCTVDVLVVVKKDVEYALFRIVQEVLKRRPPIRVEILAFVHDDRVILWP